MKSVAVAYLLWLFLGWAGVHRFYCGRPITGVIWLFTFGLLGFGVLLDVVLIPGMVEHANLYAIAMRGGSQTVNVVVNTGALGRQPLDLDDVVGTAPRKF